MSRLAELLRQSGELLAVGERMREVQSLLERGAPKEDVRATWIALDAGRDRWVQPLPPLDAVVSDALMVVAAGVRMSIKNTVLVDALRDHRDFDPERLHRIAEAELLRMAVEGERTAAVLEPIVAALPEAVGRGLAERLERENQLRRPVVHRAVARVLRESAAEDALVSQMVALAAADAADELAGAIRAAVTGPHAGAVLTGHERLAAIDALVRSDLASLAARVPRVSPSRTRRWLSTRRSAGEVR